MASINMANSKESLLRIAVVGHTNTGKTSLLRTLTRDVRFGQVSPNPSTTRHVESARLLLDGRPVLELLDTPGMEDSVSLLEFLEHLAPGERLDGPSRIQRFLETPEAKARFEQEAKVLRQMLQSDAAFYVVDARDPVLAKHRDELEVLGSCGIPLLPLLNFVSDPEAKQEPWREALARTGLHAIISFDTVAPARDGERLLYEKLATVLDSHRTTLQGLIRSHEEDARQRHAAALALLAELLVDIAACRVAATPEPESALKATIAGMNRRVREREQQCVSALLSLYSFLPEDLNPEQLPLIDGRWQDDLFDPDTLQAMGVKVGSGAAAGAAAGFGIDLMVGGISLGAAAAIGALAGGGWQTLRHYGERLLGLVSGEQSLRIDDSILRLLATRQLQLIHALEHRGHAAVEPLRFDQEKDSALWPARLPAPLRDARGHPDWSGLYSGANNGGASFDSGRHRAIRELTALLESLQEPSQEPSQ
jgi:hypothetical protein